MTDRRPPATSAHITQRRGPPAPDLSGWLSRDVKLASGSTLTVHGRDEADIDRQVAELREPVWNRAVIARAGRGN